MLRIFFFFFSFNLPNPYGRTRSWCLLSCKQKWVPKAEKLCIWGVERGRFVELTTFRPSVSRLSRQCGIINVSQPYRRPRPVTRIDLLFSTFLNMCLTRQILQPFWNNILPLINILKQYRLLRIAPLLILILSFACSHIPSKNSVYFIYFIFQVSGSRHLPVSSVDVTEVLSEYRILWRDAV
jgi:hypothetical protein